MWRAHLTVVHVAPQPGPASRLNSFEPGRSRVLKSCPCASVSADACVVSGASALSHVAADWSLSDGYRRPRKPLLALPLFRGLIRCSSTEIVRRAERISSAGRRHHRGRPTRGRRDLIVSGNASGSRMTAARPESGSRLADRRSSRCWSKLRNSTVVARGRVLCQSRANACTR